MVEVIFIGMSDKRAMTQGDYGRNSIKWVRKLNKEIHRYHSLVACRCSVANTYCGLTRQEFKKGWVYDAKSGKMLGMIDDVKWVYYKNGAWYHKLINRDGTLDSRYPEWKEEYIKKKPNTLMDMGILPDSAKMKNTAKKR